MSNNQSLWANFGAVEELTEHAAETISGGAEQFGIYNNTNQAILFLIDNTPFGLLPGQGNVYTAYNGGILQFNDDGRTNGNNQLLSADLANGDVYVFQPNYATANVSDLNIYKCA